MEEARQTSVFRKERSESRLSGGSYNYLCYRSVEELITRSDELNDMRDALIKSGYTDIAKDTQRLIEYIESAKVRIEVLFEQLEPVFHAVEWHESSDYCKDTMIKVLEKYRGGKDG